MECSVSSGKQIAGITNLIIAMWWLTLFYLFHFFSYRDPNTIKTLDIFDQSGKWVTENFQSIDDQTIFEAKLGVIKSLDAPVEAGSKGQDMFVLGLSQVRKFYFLYPK